MTKICDVCRGEIKPLRNESDEIVWDQGHNPWPLTLDNLGNELGRDARCCDECNGDVIVARLMDMKRLEQEGAI